MKKIYKVERIESVVRDENKNEVKEVKYRLSFKFEEFKDADYHFDCELEPEAVDALIKYVSNNHETAV